MLTSSKRSQTAKPKAKKKTLLGRLFG